MFLLASTSISLAADGEHRSSGFVSTDNFGQQNTGEWRERIQYHLYHVVVPGDDVMVGFAHSQRNWPNGNKFSYSIPINNKGARLNAIYAEAGLDVSGDSPAQGFEKGINYTKCSAAFPLVTAKEKKTWIEAGGSRTTTRRTLSNNGFSDGNDVNLLELSINSKSIRPSHKMSTSLSFAGNFRSNSTGHVNNAQPGRFDLNASYQLQLTKKWEVMFRGLGVLSLDPLLDSQKLVLGGFSSVRGFAPSEVKGDDGVLLIAESHHCVSKLKNSPLTFRWYADYGCVHKKKPNPGETRLNTLFSGGCGITIPIRPEMSISLDWAHPLNDHIVKDGRQHGRFWINFTTILPEI